MNVDDPVELLKHYYKSKTGTGGENYSCKLSLQLISSYLPTGIFSNASSSECLFVIKKDKLKQTNLEFTFGMTEDNQEAQNSKVMNMLSYGNAVVKKVGIFIWDRIAEREILQLIGRLCLKPAAMVMFVNWRFIMDVCKI